MLNWSELTEVSSQWAHMKYGRNPQKQRIKSLYGNNQEQPLPKHGACNLGSINLSEFVHNPFTKDAYFDTSDFVQTVHIAVRGLDEVIDENLENHALPEQRLMAENYRNIGLGIMGLHDALIKMRMTYGSQESIIFIDAIMELMFRAAVTASTELARDKGSFPAYTPALLDANILSRHFTQNEIAQLGINTYGLRNCSLLSIAPTGSLGTMLNVSTGCEPLFALYYTRKTESLNGGEDKYYKVYSGVVNEYVNKYGEDLPAYFVTSADIDWKDRVDMQSILQNHVDTAISSTINLPKDITVEEIEQLYLYAWKQGLKGITIFRDGCKRMGVLTYDDKTEDDTNKSKDDSQAVPTTYLKRGDIIECSNDLIGKKRKIVSGCGSLHILAFFDPVTGDMQEVYLNKGSTGGCANFMTGLSRTISLLCRAGVDVRTIKDQLDSTGTCPSYATRKATKHDTSKGSCCPMAIGNALVEMWEEMQDNIGEDWENEEKQDAALQSSSKPKQIITNSTALCPECGEPLVFEGGCNSCKNCGYSKCN